MALNSGEFFLQDGTVFKWVLTGSTTREICGWVEKDYTIVKGTYGWYRTAEPAEAARIAADNAGTQIMEVVS